MNNYAFIDAQNVHRGIVSLGWQLDWHKFRIYLRDKYSVQTAYLFIGYIPEKRNLYAKLQQAGYRIIFKPVMYDNTGNTKGNCDADMVLQALIDLTHYDQAVVCTSDGDFYSLVRYLYKEGKLAIVLSPYMKQCSKLLKSEAKEKITHMSNLKHKIARKI